MKTYRNLRFLFATSSALLTAWCGTTASVGATLDAIPLLGTDTTNEARAVTPDGVFVVGLSGASSGFLYNTTNGYLVQPAEPYYGTLANIATGVGYRLDTNQTPNVPQLIVSGLDGATPKHFTEWMTADGGTNWDYPVQMSEGKKPTVPVANGLAGTSWDYVFGVWTDQGPATGDNWTLYVTLVSSYWPGTLIYDYKGVPHNTGSFTQLNGVSNKGRAVGWRANSGAYITYIADMANYISIAGPTIWNSRGLDGTTSGQVQSVNADGTIIFGTSPKGVATGATNYPYKATFDTTFPGAATQLSTNPLPVFADVLGCPTNITGTINVAVPFGCSADGKFAVGMAYRGGEQAVFWDTSNPDPNQWTIVDLTAFAAANGIMGDFTNLTRAYSIGIAADSQKVIAGIGTDTNGLTRAFLLKAATFPAPVTAAQITSIANGASSCTINYTGGAGAQFVLLSSPLVNAPLSSWSRVDTNFSGSGSFIAAKSGSQRFWRIKSE